jgi:hypothetical protein
MKKITCVFAILAAASTAALAKDQDLKQDKTNGPTVATQMNDAEMDKVTAGLAFYTGAPGGGRYIDNPGVGHGYGIGRGNGAYRY